MIEPNRHLQDIVRTNSQAQGSRFGKHRLDRNERNFPFSKKFWTRIKDKMTDELICAYPEPWHAQEKLAAFLGISPDYLLLQSGSEQAIKAIFEVYVGHGDNVLLHMPSFAMSKLYAEMYQANVESSRYNSSLEFDWDDYLARIKPGLRLVLVENPNGFIGTAVPRSVLRPLIEKACTHGVIAMVDEAYFHFHDETCADWLEEFDNLIITRSLSKAFGLAGLRAGYILSQPGNIANIMKVKPAYEITSVAGMIICDLLDHPEEIQQYITQNQESLEALRLGLTGLGLECSASRANFLAVRLGESAVADALRHALLKHGILIRRPFREPELHQWVRISTADTAIQDILLSELKIALGF